MYCGLLGAKLGHSYSPLIHSQLASYQYDLLEKSLDELNTFIRSSPYTGFNVTIPYKKTVIPYCDRLSERAKMLGAVNTVIKRDDGTIWGHNTDYFGFQYMVWKSGLQMHGKKVLVLGSGGASVTASAVLKELGAHIVIISRRGENSYSTLERHRDACVIVNTTPVGMYPETGNSPVDLSHFPALEGVLDVIYNPARTQLLLDAESRGLTAMNGLWMLVAQAKESSEWFTGIPISDSVIDRIYYSLCSQMQNTILIGMPGCGKSTVGRLVAEYTGKVFVDADALIAESAGMTIPDIFRLEGEDGFRIRETAVLKELGRKSGLVIATGGGCVTRTENYPLLHQNGRIFWLQRDIDHLPTEGRPLSVSNKLQELYAIRKPMYERFADYVIDNNREISAAAETISNWEVVI